MSALDREELFLRRVVAIQHLLDECSYAEVIEVLAYVLGSIIAKADPSKQLALQRLISRRISKAAQFHEAARIEPQLLDIGKARGSGEQ